MRISDWSSDVCSSDLPTAQRWRVSWPEINEETPQCCPDGRNRLVIGGGLWRHAGACSARLRQSPTSVPYDEAEGRGDNRSPMAANDVRGLVSIWLYPATHRSEEHTSELQSLMRNSYAVFCLKKTKNAKQRID